MSSLADIGKRPSWTESIWYRCTVCKRCFEFEAAFLHHKQNVHPIVQKDWKDDGTITISLSSSSTKSIKTNVDSDKDDQNNDTILNPTAPLNRSKLDTSVFDFNENDNVRPPPPSSKPKPTVLKIQCPGIGCEKKFTNHLLIAHFFSYHLNQAVKLSKSSHSFKCKAEDDGCDFVMKLTVSSIKDAVKDTTAGHEMAKHWLTQHCEGIFGQNDNKKHEDEEGDKPNDRLIKVRKNCVNLDVNEGNPVNKSIPGFTCKICNQTFNSSKGLQIHSSLVHSSKVSSPNKNKYSNQHETKRSSHPATKNSACSPSLRTQPTRRVNVTRNRMQLRSNFTSSQLLVKKSISRSRTHKPQVTRKPRQPTQNQESGIKRKVGVKAKKYQYECNFCKFKFVTRQGLTSHLITKHSKFRNYDTMGDV